MILALISSSYFHAKTYFLYFICISWLFNESIRISFSITLFALLQIKIQCCGIHLQSNLQEKIFSKHSSSFLDPRRQMVLNRWNISKLNQIYLPFFGIITFMRLSFLKIPVILKILVETLTSIIELFLDLCNNSFYVQLLKLKKYLPLE